MYYIISCNNIIYGFWMLVYFLGGGGGGATCWNLLYLFLVSWSHLFAYGSWLPHTIVIHLNAKNVKLKEGVLSFSHDNIFSRYEMIRIMIWDMWHAPCSALQWLIYMHIQRVTHVQMEKWNKAKLKKVLVILVEVTCNIFVGICVVVHTNCYHSFQSLVILLLFAGRISNRGVSCGSSVILLLIKIHITSFTDC